MKESDFINTDEDILGGTPFFKGTRVPIHNLFEYLQAGDSIEDFLADFDYVPLEYCEEALKELVPPAN